MALTTGKYLAHETLAPGIKAIRFFRPDLRPQLDPIIHDDNELYADIKSAALDAFADGDVLIFNFGLIERFPTAFFQLMMRVRQTVLAKHGRVFLCGFRPEILPGVELMQGRRLFEMTATEEQAYHQAKARSPA
jgi:anti-anti-sigma regulatory factor